MSEFEQYSDTETTNNIETSMQSPFLAELVAQFAEFLRQRLNTVPNKNQLEKTHHTETLGEIIVKMKLNREDYPLRRISWIRRLEGSIDISHRWSSIPPPQTDPNYQLWQQLDHCVFTWIINNMASDLMNEVPQ